MTTKLLFNGELQNINGKTKALTLPGWAVRYLNERETGGGGKHLYARSSWAFSCINIRSDAIAGIPWVITAKDGTVIEGDTEASRLFDFVNDDDNWADLMRATEADLNIHGKAFWLKVGPVGGGRKIVAFQRINPAVMRVVANSSGIDHFEMKMEGRSPEKFERDQVVFFRLYDPTNDFGGIPPLEVAADDILAEAHADAYLKSFFENGAMPAAIINFKDTMIDSSQLKEQERKWNKRFAGARNAFRALFTSGEGGMDVATLGYSIEQLAMTSIREESRRAICAAFRVPMPLAGASESANFATMKEQRASLYTETAIPRADYIQGVINAEVMEKHFPGLLFEFQFKEIEALQDMVLDKANAIAELVRAGVITPLAGALTMGFDETDVGDGPQKPTLFGSAPAEPEEEELVETIPFDETEKALVVDELLKYRKFLTRRIGSGDDRPFEFKHVPDTLQVAISARLDGAETAQEIDRALSTAINWVGYP